MRLDFSKIQLKKDFCKRLQQSGYSANRDRNNLSRAWEWGRKFLDGFPNQANPFALVDRFKEERQPRCVPPRRRTSTGCRT